MAALNTDELQTALFGTWTAVARIAELLTQRTGLSGEELGSLLTTAEMTAADRQTRIGIAIVRDIMESAVRYETRQTSAPLPGGGIGQFAGRGAEAWPAPGAEPQAQPAANLYPTVKGSDFDDATLPGRRTERVREGADRRPRRPEPASRPAPASPPSSSRRIADHVAGRQRAALADTTV